MKKITAFAPATVANFVCGYDILGFAIEGLGDEVTVSFNHSKQNSFELISDQPELKNLPVEKNVAYRMVELVQHAVQRTEGIHIRLNKKMPLNSGLGSSSASSVAALVAANALLEANLNLEQLLPLAMEGERMACGNAHADNVAPCLCGGIVLVKSYEPLEIVSLPTPPHWYVAVLHPQVDVPTKEARRILKPKVKLKDAVVQFGNIAGLVAGIYSLNDELVSRSMQDVLIEPYRAMLIPYFYEMKEKALELGAIGFGISGSGPSVFALCTSQENAQRVAQRLTEVLTLYQVGSESYVSPISTEGAKIIH
jgi:homoserine kinase